MKCIQNLETMEVKRLSDKEALIFVEEKGWVYIAKSVWRAQLQVPKKKREKES